MFGILHLVLYGALCYAIAVPQNQKEGGDWKTLPSIAGGPRQEDAVVATSDAVWVLGGTMINPFRTVDTVEYYSLKDNSWHSAKSFGTPLNHVNSAVVGDEIYIVGGLSEGQKWLAQNTSLAYSVSTDSWKQRSAMPQGTERGACAVGVYGTTIYLAGGMTVLDLDSGNQDALATVTAYDTASDTWNVNLPPLPQPRQHVAGAVVGTTFYVLGGRTNGQYKIQNNVYALDLTNPASGWKEMAPLPTARGGLSCAAVAEVIYCLGGEGDEQTQSQVFPQVQAYNTATNQWSSLADMPLPKHGWGVAVIGNTIYSPGGGIRAGTDPTDQFDCFTP
ncbi:hypothetical protein CERZMDRAFT_97904 [Cercospora zeae-maydis SCOH1-5]|uniref:Galactose oxidase n=1 Tax=Cercospora zeae-maydis SCOH1-5 TaxID=717836 RepID=A0A6A6FEZ9_9PEZI|nr:hypothetical protein CERZMDRAFT_97904 [Cercospora zeae-maydis SCOH1-5]